MNILEEIQNCPIEWKELGEVCEIVRGVRITKKELIEEGFPVVSGGTSFMGYTNKYNREANTITIAQYGTAGYVDWQTEKFWANDVCFSVYPQKSILNRFLYYFLKNRQNYLYDISNKTAVPYSISKEKILRIKMPIPPLEIQEKIVQTLDKMTEYVTELTSELTSRKKQYSFYRDKLLSFEDEVYHVEWKTLGEVAECLAGATPRTSNSSYWENGTIPWMSSGEVNKGFVYDTEKKITQEGYDSCSTKVVPRDTVVIALAGQGKTRGTVAITKVELCTNQSLCSIVSNDDINSHYLYYYLKGQYQKFRDISSGEGTRGGLNLKMIRDFRIPVPSLEIQSRIVQVLDNFDSVCNDLNIGLPKEIELRQKQYEYFRDKLLTFVAEGEYTDSTVQTRHN